MKLSIDLDVPYLCTLDATYITFIPSLNRKDCLLEAEKIGQISGSASGSSSVYPLARSTWNNRSNYKKTCVLRWFLTPNIVDFLEMNRLWGALFAANFKTKPPISDDKSFAVTLFHCSFYLDIVCFSYSLTNLIVPHRLFFL